jgi:tetratricopeptide (TPR) repeat protein
MEKRGVKVQLMRAICDVALNINADPTHWTMGRVSAVINGNHEILKADSRWAADCVTPTSTLTYDSKLSLIDMLRLKHNETAHPTLGVSYSQVVGAEANIFVSFAYSDNFLELVESLEEYLRNQSDFAVDTVYFWFDMFVNNQWEAAEHDFEWWATTFRTAVKSIGHTVLFLSPWDNPTMLKRAWCLYEISCSETISVVLSPKQMSSFMDVLTTNATSVNWLLFQIDLEKSDCFLPTDKQRIFEVVRSMEGGFAKLNNYVIRHIKKWISTLTLMSVERFITREESENELGLLVHSAIILSDQGNLKAAKPLYERSLLGYESQLGADHFNTLKLLINLANLLQLEGDLDAAKPLYERALRGFESMLGVDDLRTLAVMNNYAYLLQHQGDLVSAKPLCERVLIGRERLLGVDDSDTLASVYNFIFLLQKLHDTAAADALLSRFPKCAEGYCSSETIADLPESVDHASHPHTLTKAYDQSFLCDVCHCNGGGCSYSCSACNFDTHPRCVCDLSRV